MTPGGALEAVPAFARVNAVRRGTAAVDATLDMKTEAGGSHPTVLPTGDEVVIASYGGRLRAVGMVDETGRPVAAWRSNSFGLVDLFDVVGTFTLTERRLIGTGVSGESALGPVPKGVAWLNFSIPLADIWNVELLRVPRRHGPWEDLAVKLEMLDHGTALRIRVTGQLGRGAATRTSVRTVMATLVDAACEVRLRGELAPSERQRLVSVRDECWSGRDDFIAARIRHPDDVPDLGWGDRGE